MMQLGTRWTSGDEPPVAVPKELRDEIRAVDAALPADLLGMPRPRWTLTWLEGRATAELDTGVAVRAESDGTISVSPITD